MARQLLHAPTFTAPVVVGLAVAIGATTTVFSVFSAMLLRSMGFRNADRIVALWRTDEAHGQKSVELSYSDWQRWRTAGDTLEDVALASSVNLDFTLFAGDRPEHVDGSTVTGNFFRVLGAAPLAGRLLTEEDDRPGARANVVLSYGLWRSRFGSDYALVGRQLRLGPGAVTVVGIARPEFDYPQDVAVWVPLRVAWPGVEQSADLGVFRGVARLRRGVGAASARARLDAMARLAESTLAPNAGQHRVAVTPILDEIYGAARPAVWILLGAVLLVLLIACANAASLLLNRATERGRELAIRAALGASRGALVRLLLSESVMLAATAGLGGLALAAAGVNLLSRLAPLEVPRIAQASLDLPVLAFGLALSLATVLLFGVGPAWTASRRDANEILKQAGRGSVDGLNHTRLRRLLIAGEGALSALLLVAAGMLVHSFANLSHIDPGFRAERLLTFRVTTERPGQESRRTFFAEVLRRVRALPGVELAGAVLIRPLSGAVGWDTLYTVEGQSPERRSTNPNGNYEAISPGYFGTMGIRLVAGRDFNDADTSTAGGVVILDEATARRHWPRGDAVGKRIRLGANPKAPWLAVVGVVGQVRYREWETARPDFYVPYMQRAQHRSDFVVKAKGDPAALAAAVRGEVYAADKTQPISNVTTMAELVDRTLSRSRFNGVMMAALSLCAVLLAAIGVYGTVSYSVTQRRAEIGVRMAMGATPAQVAGLVASDGIRPLLLGLVVGLAPAIWARDLLAAVVFGTGDFDRAAFGFAVCALLLTGAAACLGPARRAAATDPARALQGE